MISKLVDNFSINVLGKKVKESQSSNSNCDFDGSFLEIFGDLLTCPKIDGINTKTSIKPEDGLDEKIKFFALSDPNRFVDTLNPIVYILLQKGITADTKNEIKPSLLEEILIFESPFVESREISPPTHELLQKIKTIIRKSEDSILLPKAFANSKEGISKKRLLKFLIKQIDQTQKDPKIFSKKAKTPLNDKAQGEIGSPREIQITFRKILKLLEKDSPAKEKDKINQKTKFLDTLGEASKQKVKNDKSTNSKNVNKPSKSVFSLPHNEDNLPPEANKVENLSQSVSRSTKNHKIHLDKLSFYQKAAKLEQDDKQTKRAIIEMNVKGTSQKGFPKILETLPKRGSFYRQNVVNRENIISHIKGIILNAPKGETTVTVEIEPKKLGKLKLYITVKDDLVKTHIIAQSFEVKQILESGLSLLKDGLFSSGLKLSEFSVFLTKEGLEKENWRWRGKAKGQRFLEKGFENEYVTNGILYPIHNGYISLMV